MIFLEKKNLILFLSYCTCFNILHVLQKPSPSYFCLNLFEVIFPILFPQHEMFSTYEGNMFLMFNSYVIPSMKPLLNQYPYFPGGNDHTIFCDPTVFYTYRFLTAPIILLHLLVRFTLQKACKDRELFCVFCYFQHLEQYRITCV